MLNSKVVPKLKLTDSSAVLACLRSGGVLCEEDIELIDDFEWEGIVEMIKALGTSPDTKKPAMQDSIVCSKLKKQ